MARPNYYKNGSEKVSYRIARDAHAQIAAYAQKQRITEARAASELIMLGANKPLKLNKA